MEGSVSTARAGEWLRAAQESADQVGRMPPAPPTVRARAGGFVVRLVQRMLFWFTPQINSANQAMLSVIQEQTNLIAQLSDQVGTLKAQMGAMSAAQFRAGQDSDRTNERLEQLLGAMRQSETTREAFAKDAEKQLVQLRTIHFANERRLAVLVDEVGKHASTGASSAASEILTKETAHESDSLYLLLEDKFRGSRDDIRSRLVKYLPYVRDHAPVLDLGCGRGEWLELLRDNGLPAAGVDMNRTFVSQTQDLGLEVTLGDAIAHVQHHPEASLGCITGFHLVEHLPWLKLAELIDAAVRALKPGGIVIFETPNPENTQVGSCNFYFDPTHRNPIPPLLLQFLLDARGLTNVEILRLHPYPESMRVPEDGLPVTQRFNDFFYGSQDYAVIGRKP